MKIIIEKSNWIDQVYYLVYESRVGNQLFQLVIDNRGTPYWITYNIKGEIVNIQLSVTTSDE